MAERDRPPAGTVLADGTRATPSLTQDLLDFALSTPTDAIPESILRQAGQRVIDTIGVALACASSGLGTAAARVVLAERCDGPASVWAAGTASSGAASAAFANGMLAHGMDYDDTHTTATLHPGVVMVPTALAVGEDVGSSGRDVLAAVAIGYEIAARLGRSASGEFQRNGFHPSAVLGIFGGTAAAARLTGATHAHAVHAAGVAGSLACGLMEYLADGTETKQVHPGVAAHGAIRAVQLAGYGATGPATVLEGRSGVFRSFSKSAADAAAIRAELGQRWVGMDVATKPYPACHCVHAPVDAWRQIRDAEGLGPDDIGRIRRLVGLVPSWYLQLICDPMESKRAPRSVYEARFSLPYALARVVVDGRLSLDSFDPDRLADPDVLALAQRVDYEVLEYDEFPEAFPGGLRVEMDDGRVYEAHLRHNVGSVGNPMTEEQIDGKFVDAASRAGSADAAAELLAALHALVRPNSTLAEVSAALARFDTLSEAPT